MGANHQYVHAIQPEKIKASHGYLQSAYITGDEKGKYINSHIRCQQKQYNAWKAKISTGPSQNAISHQYLYLPTKTSFQYDKGYCSNTGSAINIYPYFQSLLSQEIQKRVGEKNYFKQSELWYLLYVLTAAKIEINKLGQRVGDIKPSNVFIDQSHKIKIGNILTSPNQQTNYYKFINKQSDFLPFEEQINTTQNSPKQFKFNFLLAPQDIDQARKDLVNNKGNYKSQIFSIGATIISTGLLDSLQDAYDYSKIVFKLDVWKDKLNQWINHPKYSEIFKSVVLNLVEKDPLKRIELPALWTFLSRYNLSINGKQPFIIVHPPDCLEKGIQAIRNKKIESV